MVELGYALSSEEHAPNDLVRYARAAEQAGFEFALVSDHFHPWVDRQGESPFVWPFSAGSPDQEGFFEFYEREILPRVAGVNPRRAVARMR
jgi:coenzyme F420-dependent glucose-6-phosphate dehydrogenase